MGDKDTESKFKNIEFASVSELSKSLDRCSGYYSFFLGAGSSKPAGIPTSSELIEQWKQERYRSEFGDVEEIDEAEIREWANDVERKEMAGNDNEYGFWFEKQYLTRGERRKFIQNVVSGIDPTFGHIVLASMMEENVVPVTLTPNFDDLLYDAFYLFLEEKPLMIDHNAIAPEYQLTREQPTIIKLHGDYLYDNLKNTNSETSELEKNMETAVSKTLNEYGMVVIGYSGEDESIMQLINSVERNIPDYGLFWCVLDKTDLSDRVLKLLEKTNTFLIEIDGFESMMSKLYSDLSQVNVPMPHELQKSAEKRQRTLVERVSETEGTEFLELRMAAQQYSERENYDRAVDMLTQIINNLSEDSDNLRDVYRERAMNYLRNGQYQEAISDYYKAISLKEKPGTHLELAEAYILSDNPTEAIQHINEIGSEENIEKDLIATFLEMIAKMQNGESYQEEIEYINKIQDKDPVSVAWEFKTLQERLDYLEISEDQMEKINQLIETLQTPKNLEDRISYIGHEDSY